MKPVVIIAVAVGLSVVAVIGVLVAWQGVAVWQDQIAFDEYQEQQLKKLEREAEIADFNSASNCLNKDPTEGEIYDACVKMGYYNFEESLRTYCGIYHIEGGGNYKNCMMEKVENMVDFSLCLDNSQSEDESDSCAELMFVDKEYERHLQEFISSKLQECLEKDTQVNCDDRIEEFTELGKLIFGEPHP